MDYSIAESNRAIAHARRPRDLTSMSGIALVHDAESKQRPTELELCLAGALAAALEEVECLAGELQARGVGFGRLD